MADMIDAKDAKAQLNCDDATLQSHINSGALRAQRVGGKLMLNSEDVAKLAKDGEDGTIVLTGDSENLSIDLGKVVDDQAATMAQGKDTRKDDSITFGDELEVVSYDDGNTKQLKQDTKPTANAGGLNFTDTNTAVITAVDETAVGSTGVSDTVESTAASQRDLDRANRGGPSSDSSRRSVRSTRMRPEAPKVGWFWLTCMVLSLVISLCFTSVYYYLAFYNVNKEDSAGNPKRGMLDTFYTNMAGGQFLAGFSVEPDKTIHDKLNNNDSPWRDIGNKDAFEPDREVKWRAEEYLGGKRSEPLEDRVRAFLDNAMYNGISDDGKTLTTKSGRSVPITKATDPVTGVEITTTPPPTTP